MFAEPCMTILLSAGNYSKLRWCRITFFQRLQNSPKEAFWGDRCTFDAQILNLKGSDHLNVGEESIKWARVNSTDKQDKSNQPWECEAALDPSFGVNVHVSMIRPFLSVFTETALKSKGYKKKKKKWRHCFWVLSEESSVFAPGANGGSASPWMSWTRARWPCQTISASKPATNLSHLTHSASFPAIPVYDFPILSCHGLVVFHCLVTAWPKYLLGLVQMTEFTYRCV